MATKINLLPVELGANKDIVKFAETLRNLAYILVTFFILGLIGSGLYIFLLTTQLNNLNTSKQSLSTNIKNLSQTEQSYFLLKDRIGKAMTVLGKKSLEGELVSLESLVAGLPEGVVFTEGVFGETKNEYSFLSNNSVSLVSFLTKVIAEGTYKRIYLKNFSFNQSLGYILTLEVER